MALTESNMMELGTVAPEFTLPDTVSGKELSLDSLKSEVATVVTFICNHCPYVHHINTSLVELAKRYQTEGVRFVAISSNNVLTHPQDAPHLMTEVAKREGYPFPYLYDESQEVAKAFRAECTPDFFIFDGSLKCAYRGRFDDTRPNMGQATGKDIANALDALIAGQAPPTDQYPSMGCGIKWKN
ncbi:thioredoxin family protein [Cryomorphaceae bacterium 1068]|nr:thioredoxin family protein [Cryomorphaceae bacterium 1068]